MNNTLLINGNLREKVGTGASRDLKRKGYVPAIIYSKGEESKLISIAQKEANTLYNNFQIKSMLINLKIEDKNYYVLPKHFSLHPVTDAVDHIDFIFTDKVSELKMHIPVRLKGKDKSIGIKKGGVVNLVFKTLSCKVLKDNIPQYIEVDTTEMDIGIILTLKDIVLPIGVELLTRDLNQTFLRLTGKKKIIEEAEIKAPTEKGESTEEGEATTETTATKDGKGGEAATKKETEEKASTASPAESSDKKGKK